MNLCLSFSIFFFSYQQLSLIHLIISWEIWLVSIFVGYACKDETVDIWIFADLAEAGPTLGSGVVVDIFVGGSKLSSLILEMGKTTYI